MQVVLGRRVTVMLVFARKQMSHVRVQATKTVLKTMATDLKTNYDAKTNTLAM